jgi:hypothetical protein
MSEPLMRMIEMMKVDERAFCKSHASNGKEEKVYYFSPLSLGPFPPMGAREIVAQQ